MGTSRFQGDTRNPAVNVTTFVLLVTVILSVSVRLGTKLALFKKLTIDDIVIIASLVFAIGQDIAVSLSVESGYGSHYQDVSSADLDRVMKVFPSPTPTLILQEARLTSTLAGPLHRFFSVYFEPPVIEAIRGHVYPGSLAIIKG